jgi:hypothetical protein
MVTASTTRALDQQNRVHELVEPSVPGQLDTGAIELTPAA